jgi:hypothetical protein
MGHEVAELREAFVDAYPRYVAVQLNERGIAMDPLLADAVVEGTAVLDGLLASLERLPPTEQRHSPLELFREALRPISHALDVAGIEPPSSASATASLAWDRHSLSPGSSQVLGTDAHHAHLAWGVAKARAIAPLVVGPPVGMMWTGPGRAEIADLLASRGMRVVDDASPGTVSMVVIEAGVASTAAWIRAFASTGAYIVVAGEDVDDLSAPALKALGADVVVTTRRLLEAPDLHLPELA